MFSLAMDDPFGYAIAGSLVPFTDTTGRTLVSPVLVPSERVGIFIIDGQSLASNHCAAAYTVTNPTKVQCVNWGSDRKLYQHKEPMMGGTFWPADHFPDNVLAFPYTSVWGKVGDLLIDGSTFDRIIWLNVSAGGVQAASLAPGGVLGKRISMAFHVLSSLGIRGNQVSGSISMLGESDGAGITDPAAFKASRRETIRVSRSFGFTGPWFIPQETYVAGTIYPPIRTAQSELAAEAGNVLGPDFDTLGSFYRGPDNIHQGSFGRDAIASMWFDCIKARFT